MNDIVIQVATKDTIDGSDDIPQTGYEEELNNEWNFCIKIDCFLPPIKDNFLISMLDKQPLFDVKNCKNKESVYLFFKKRRDRISKAKYNGLAIIIKKVSTIKDCPNSFNTIELFKDKQSIIDSLPYYKVYSTREFPINEIAFADVLRYS